MPKKMNLHPKAYLRSKRNVQAGLISRTKIIQMLEKGRRSTRHIAKETSLSYECVAYHLNTMRRDRLVDRSSKTKPFTWALTPFGQQRLAM
jgi:predicted transcriptional regulator